MTYKRSRRGMTEGSGGSGGIGVVGVERFYEPEWKLVAEWAEDAKVVVCGGDVATSDMVDSCTDCGIQIGHDLMLDKVPEKLCVRCWERRGESDEC